MNNQDVKAIENTCSYADYSDELEAIINKERKRWPINEVNSIENRTTMIAINSFDYGVIIGKRLERAKKRGKENNFKKGGM
jgi:hypothetical protein